MSFRDERQIAGSDDRDEIEDAYTSAKRKFKQIPDTCAKEKAIGDTTLGNLCERLSVIDYANNEPDIGRENHRRAKNHYYWADTWQEKIIDTPISQFYRGSTLFNHARTLALESALEIISFETYPQAYRYLETDRRNHEGILRHLYDVIEVGTIIGLPEPNSHSISDLISASERFKQMDRAHERARTQIASEPYARLVLERTKRSERILSNLMMFSRYLSHR